MRMLITRRRHLGLALDAKALRNVKPVSSVIEVVDERVPVLNRQSRVAKTSTGWPKEGPPLPLLLDVTLSTMGPTGFILSGLEEVDGALYAQSWWCREA